MFSKIFSISLVFVIGISACAPQTASKPKTLTILAAASLTESFTEMGELFESYNPGVSVVFSFGGSQTLAEQLNQGAPADVFASASQKYMDAAIESRRVNDGESQIFATNRLVVIFPADNPAGLVTLQDLANEGLKLDLADQSVPVGQYSLDVLDKASRVATFGADFKDKVLKNVVSYETDVKVVVSKVSLGEADAGIVYITDFNSAAGKLGNIDIPEMFNTVAEYPIAPIADSQNADLARAFIEMVMSPEGQAVMAKYGFMSVK